MILKWIFKNAEKCRLDSSGSKKRPREKGRETSVS
jgi:hypothetical protein